METAISENADIIGLSGLITPSLDEMIHVAKEMQRQEFNIPLLIGGATTSRTHTAVKIEPVYDGPVIHVKDASRAVGVAQNLVKTGQRDHFVSNIRNEYETVRQRHNARDSRIDWLSLEQARKNKLLVDWQSYQPPVPIKLGIEKFDDYPLTELVDYIDWTPFFVAWELAGRFPKILDDPVVGQQARTLYGEAQEMLAQLVDGHWLTARGVIGLFAANALGDDDIAVYTDAQRRGELAVVHTLRQQTSKSPGQANHALADFVAPEESGVDDYFGAFAVSTGFGIEAKLEEFEQEHDDYRSIMLKAIADRLAEAFAERMHERVRREFWGYGATEDLDNTARIAEKYQGIRPAPGYPACPDHTEKPILWEMLQVEQATGITLTDSFAMYPAASVSGWYFSHSQSRYFGLGKINKDQVHDYARRKGMDLAAVERWLAPNLGYDPDL